MNIPAVLIRLAPAALRVAKFIVAIAPHAMAIYQYRKETKLPVSKKRLK